MTLVYRTIRHIPSTFSCEHSNVPSPLSRIRISNSDRRIWKIPTCGVREKIAFYEAYWGCRIYGFYRNERDLRRHPERHE